MTIIFNILIIYSNNLNLLILKNKIYYLKFFYFIFLLKELNYNININFHYILNLYIFVYLEFLKKKKLFICYNIYYFKRNNNLKLYFFDDINFRMDLVILFRN